MVTPDKNKLKRCLLLTNALCLLLLPGCYGNTSFTFNLVKNVCLQTNASRDKFLLNSSLLLVLTITFFVLISRCKCFSTFSSTQTHTDTHTRHTRTKTRHAKRLNSKLLAHLHFRYMSSHLTIRTVNVLLPRLSVLFCSVYLVSP